MGSYCKMQSFRESRVLRLIATTTTKREMTQRSITMESASRRSVVWPLERMMTIPNLNTTRTVTSCGRRIPEASLSLVRLNTGLVFDDGSSLNFRYSHVNHQDRIMTGHRKSTAAIIEDGRIRLYEKWQWTRRLSPTVEASEKESVESQSRTLSYGSSIIMYKKYVGDILKPTMRRKMVNF
jgi:hypothetical protein